MTKKRAAALATFLRESADARSIAAETTNADKPAEEGMRLLDAAEAAERLSPADPRLSQLAAAHRFATFYGHVRFLGGGDAVRQAVLAAATCHPGEGQRALNAVIAAALSERPPGGEG